MDFERTRSVLSFCRLIEVSERFLDLEHSFEKVKGASRARILPAEKNGKGRKRALPFSRRQWGRSTELSIVFTFLRHRNRLRENRGGSRELRAWLEIVTLPGCRVSGNRSSRERRSIDPCAPELFHGRRPSTANAHACHSNNRPVCTLTNFRELAIKGNEETGKPKARGKYRRLPAGRGSCENSPRFDAAPEASVLRSGNVQEISVPGSCSSEQLVELSAEFRQNWTFEDDKLPREFQFCYPSVSPLIL